jgi:acetylornithine deacetylase/succinyl-diaminopimelate desuccinylase-like protein
MKSAASAMPSPASISRLSAVPAYNAQLRTTCVATLLDGGHAENALPQTAGANVNCRVLPGESIDAVQKKLVQVLGDTSISVTMKSTPVPSPPSPLNPEIMQAVERLTAEYWPGIPVIPTMSSGATDGAFLRNAGIPTYGHSGLAGDIDDNRAHGKDERVSVKAFDQGQEYLYWLVRTLSSAK